MAVYRDYVLQRRGRWRLQGPKEQLSTENPAVVVPYGPSSSDICWPDVLQVPGFFKGMALPLTTVSMTSSVAFGTYRNCLHCLCQARGADGGPSTKLDVFLSGVAGGVAQVRDSARDVPLQAGSRTYV